jgi:hypothetical protein
MSIAGSDVHLITAVNFVATKLEAFHGRGANDVTLSHDLEDIVAVIDGRSEIVTNSRPPIPPSGPSSRPGSRR